MPRSPFDAGWLLRHARPVTISALGALAVSFAVLWGVGRATEQWVRQSREVSRTAREVRMLALDRQAAVRGYVITGDSFSYPLMLERTRALWPKVDSLVTLTTGSPAQHERVMALRDAIAAWDTAFAQRVPELRASLSPAAVAARDRNLFEPVRTRAAAVLEAEEERYRDRVRGENVAQLVVAAIVLLELVLLALVTHRMYVQGVAQAKELRDKQHMLEEQAAELEQQVEELQVLTEELESTNTELVEEMQSRERAEAAHATSESLLRFVLESSPVGIALNDLDGRFRLVNRAFAEATGLPPAEHLGRTLEEVDPRIARVIMPLLQQCVREARPISDIRLDSEDTDPRTRRSWIGSMYPVRDRTGTIRGVGGILVDVTDRERLEHQLQQSQKMEAVGRLAGGVAHDFNNLLTVILSYATLAQQNLAPGDPLHADLNEILESAKRAAALTGQLLAFSRKQLLQPEPLDLNTIVESVERMLRRLIGEDIELALSLSPSVPRINADRGQLEQVLMNLAVNARDAMPEGGRLLIETGTRDLDAEHAGRMMGVPPGRYVMLSVSDTGVGMTREVQDQIFDPFFTTKAPGQGTGLGLSTVHGIVKQSGGDLWVYSEPGQGTTFRIFFPIAEGEPLPMRTGEHQVRRAAGTETILLVEDDAALRPLTTRILTRAGYRVLTASNGLEALEIAKTYRGDIHLVATDVVMPHVSGHTLVQELVAARPTTKVLYMSGYTDDDLVRRGIYQARSAFLQKPFTPAELAGKVREVLDT